MSETIKAVRLFEDQYGSLDRVNVMVLGCGVNTINDLEPEDVTRGSASSDISYQRAVAGAKLTNDLNQANYDVNLIMSGHRTFFLPRRIARDNSTESRGMAEAAWPIITNHERTELYSEDTSQSTYGNFLETLKRGWINPEGLTVLVTDKNHMDRALDIGQFVMPGAVLIGHTAPIENAVCENGSSAANDMAKKIYGIAMLGVEPGNVTSIRRRNWAVQLVGQTLVDSLDLARRARNAIRSDVHATE